MYHSELFHDVENFLKKRLLVEIRAKYFFIGAKIRGVETEWREAVTSRRLRDQFCGAWR